MPVAVFSPSLPEPGCQLFPALGSATPGHSYSWATWNPASRPVSSEPPRLPCFTSYACRRSGSMRQGCPHLVLDVTQGPGPCVFTAGHPQIIQDSWGPSISIPPEVLGFIYSVQSRLINLSPHASCSASPGSWPRHPLRVTPRWEQSWLVPCHRERCSHSQAPRLQHPAGVLLVPVLPRWTHLPSLSFGGPPEPRKTHTHSEYEALGQRHNQEGAAIIGAGMAESWQ